MKKQIIWLAIISLTLLNSNAFAQNAKKDLPVVGTGTQGYVPVFYAPGATSTLITDSRLHYGQDPYEHDTILISDTKLKLMNTLQFPNKLNYIDQTTDLYRTSSLTFRTGFDGHYIEDLTITNDDGKTLIGIADTTPQHTLDVNGVINSDSVLTEGLKLTTSSAQAGRVLQCIDSEGNAEWADVSTGATSYWSTFTYDDLRGTGIYTTKGRVGINRTGAAYELDVTGTTRSTYKIISPRAEFSTLVEIDGDLDANTGSFSGDLELSRVLMNNDELLFTANNNTTILTINPSDIIIGHNTYGSTTNLTVNGKILAKEVEIVQDVWSDYVFAEDYILRPLSEVKQFIQTHQHLPNIPSEQEVKENGINLSEMNAKLLEKVEELTLYIIQQQEKMNKMENRLNQIEQNQ